MNDGGSNELWVTHRVNLVLGSYGVGHEEADEVLSRKACVLEARDQLVSSVVGLGHQEVGRGLRDVRATGLEGEAGTTRAVRDTDCACELDAEKN